MESLPSLLIPGLVYIVDSAVHKGCVLALVVQPKGNYIGTSNNTKLVHWQLMGALLHLVQREGAWAGCGPAQSPPRCTRCNSPPIKGQCTNHCIAM